MLSPFEDLSLSFSDMFTVTIFKGAALFVGVCFFGFFFPLCFVLLCTCKNVSFACSMS